jgi:hypothetical protein
VHTTRFLRGTSLSIHLMHRSFHGRSSGRMVRILLYERQYQDRNRPPANASSLHEGMILFSWSSKTIKININNDTSYTAPLWFQPTERFSLLMYLASPKWPCCPRTAHRFLAAGTMRIAMFCWLEDDHGAQVGSGCYSGPLVACRDTLALQVCSRTSRCAASARFVAVEYTRIQLWKASPLSEWFVEKARQTSIVIIFTVPRLDGLLACPLTQVGAPIDR